MKQCCEDYIYHLQPKSPRDGNISEIHICPACGKKLQVSFKCNSVLGGDLICTVISAEYSKVEF